jgi:hypothetical protein
MMKKGDVLYCNDCGLAVVVDEECGCVETELVCCGELMVQGKPSTRRKKKLEPKARGKLTTKKIRAKAKK